MKSVYALGADPELFLFSKGLPISAIDKLPGTKEFPHQVDVLPPKFCVQVDNCSVEYNIPPTTDTHEFVKSNNLMLLYLKQYFKPQKLQVKAVASVLFDPKQLQDPRAWIFGCEPDYNAWTLTMNPPPKCDTLELRSAGGHIHVGCMKYSNFDKIALVRCLDYYVDAK